MSTPEKHSILIVDDEPEILFSLRSLLRREFELFTAETGMEALDILAQHPIHVIMTDQRMPEMSGTELMGRVKTQYPDAIRIVFTGYSDIKAVIQAINSGGLFRYLTKPWDPDDLVDVLREAANKYDELVERRQLLRDTKEYLSKEQHLFRDMESALPDNNVTLKTHLEKHNESAIKLIDRVERLIKMQEKENNSDVP